MIKGMKPQTIIQGKTYGLRIKFSQEDLLKFNKMWFSCAGLNILREMEFNGEDSYSFELSWQETQALNPCTTTFNITIQLVGTERKRDLANGIILTVEKNKNPVPEISEEA